MSTNRREFLKNSAVLLGTMSVPTASSMGNSLQDPPDPEPEFLNEEIFLWQDGSTNNGNNPNYRPKIRIYYPTLRNKDSDERKNGTDKKLAAVLICPGGGYYVQAPHEGQPFAQLLAMHGIVSAVLTYRVFPDRYPGSYSDACRAIRILRKNADKYNIDPSKIGIMGFSAGGHLASTVATQPNLYKDPQDDLVERISARPDRLILGYPVISFIDDYAHKGSARSLLGDDPDPDMAKQLSNNHQVTKDNPPAFLFHTADDSGVPPQNSISFAEACLKNNIPVELHVYQTGKHGVGMALENHSLKTWTELLMNWLDPWRSR
jgi:acetyl esterase/lipase